MWMRIKRSVYQNKQEFKNTLDNLGRYKIVEKKAPKGCILTKQEWTFELSENTDNKENPDFLKICQQEKSKKAV